MTELTQERLKEVLHYNPDTGVFTWLKETGRKIKIGKVAGSINGQGYIQITCSDKNYLAHRLVFLYMEGKFPLEQGDHKNHIRHDNRWCNLRKTSNQENQRNASMRIDNTSGFTGVCWVKASNKWMTHIRVNGKTRHLGYFCKFSDAVMARKEANIKYNFHENHGVPT